MSNAITKAYIRHYSDNKQTTAYVEWGDGSLTEGPAKRIGGKYSVGLHMHALLARATREGVAIGFERW